MKKIVFLFSVIVACFFISCNNSGGGMSDKAKKNLETAQAIAKSFESGDWSKIGDYIATDAVDHAGMQGDVKGIDSIKAYFASMGAMMSDMKNETVREFADDDYVVQWMKESSTMKTDMMGLKAGKRYTFNAVEISKFKDGKVSEHWGFIDFNDMGNFMPQGGMSDMMGGNKTDTSGAKTNAPK